VRMRDCRRHLCVSPPKCPCLLPPKHTSWVLQKLHLTCRACLLLVRSFWHVVWLILLCSCQRVPSTPWCSQWRVVSVDGSIMCKGSPQAYESCSSFTQSIPPRFLLIHRPRGLLTLNQVLI
jgi:hypothetical protein